MRGRYATANVATRFVNIHPELTTAEPSCAADYPRTHDEAAVSSPSGHGQPQPFDRGPQFSSIEQCAGHSLDFASFHNGQHAG